MASHLKCIKCGSSVEDAASWCTSCGAPLPVAQKTAPGAPIPEALGAFGPTSLDGAAFRARAQPQAQPQPKQAQPKQAHLEQGRVIDGKYTIVRVLGEGGMGVVYLARDIHTGMDVVLKSMRPELAHRADIRERTLAEGRALARIDHPHVVHLNAVVADKDGLWLVMQYIDGESLDATIRRANAQRDPIPFPRVIALFRQILQGVAAAHQEGVIHRDLKPANILVRKKDGLAKVTDFGIAKPEEKARAGKGNTKGVVGSLWYMSPEQVQGKKELDKRVDIYGLGILLYELLVGEVPFDADSSYELMRKHVEEPLPRVSLVRPDVPMWIEHILAKACAKDREDRYRTCEEMLEAIDEYAPHPISSKRDAITSGAMPAAAITVNAMPPRTPLSPVWIFGPLAIVVLAIMGGVGYFGFGVFRSEANGAGSRNGVSSRSPSSGEATDPSASAGPDSPTKDALDLITGAWKSETGHAFEAVRVGDAVEFRIVNAVDFAPQDYLDGEARFVLTALPNEDGAYAVEDRIRPLPPNGTTFDSAKSRGTCEEVWTDVQGKPLRASFDGRRVSVEYAKIAPTSQNFTISSKKVVACAGLRAVSASRGSMSFTR